MDLENENEIKKISHIEFGILSDEQVRNQSVCEVKYHDTFCGTRPIANGLFDLRMGATDFNTVCPTDGKYSSSNTSGFFGHVELAKPVYNTAYFSTIMKVCRCICIKCSKVLINESMDFQKHCDSSKKIKKCPHCNIPLPVYKKIDYAHFNAIFISDENVESVLEMKPQITKTIFEGLSDEDVTILGLNPEKSHPKFMIITALPVLPPACRPSVHVDSGSRMEDDLSVKYSDIIKTNNTLREKIKLNTKPKFISDYHNLLQYHIATLFDNEMSGVAQSTQRSGRPLRGFRQRLRGKEGRIRGNLLGKRVNHSARTVITPDPNINLDELGVPKKIAMRLTFPETVNKNNLDKMRRLVLNGNNIYPGARSVYKYRAKTMISLNHIDLLQFSRMLEVNDIVVRHIQDGDWVLLNRQPSLHRMSMMAHKIRVLDGLTFRMNVSVTTPYNADFDGDEMNIHVPQSVITMNEIKCLASVNTQIVSPASNEAIIYFVQDSLLTLHLMTLPSAHPVDYNDVLNICSEFNNIKIDYKKNYTAKELLSLALPCDMNLKIVNSIKKVIKIENGKILEESSYFDKASSNKLIAYIYRVYGQLMCSDFFNKIQRIMLGYLLRNSFSVGLSDLLKEKEDERLISANHEKHVTNVNKIQRKIIMNKLTNKTEKTANEFAENQIMDEMASSRNYAENLLKDHHSKRSDNRFMNMVHGGSKGKLINLSQMTVSLGQQVVDGKRIENQLNGRTLPCYKRYDKSLESRGYVKNSFKTGITPSEFFHHAIAGREGIIDTAVRTASTGYIQRKLIKSLEDLVISPSKCVTDSVGNVIEVLYGDDNLNSTEITKIKFGLLEKTNEYINGLSSDSVFNENLIKCRDSLLSAGFDSLYNFRQPIDFEKYIQTYSQCRPNGNAVTEEYVIRKYDELCDQLSIHNRFSNELYLFKHYLKFYGYPTLMTKLFCKDQFDTFLEKIKMKYLHSRIDVSDAVGCVTAQSIGEPCTQLTLNVFHTAGVGKSNIVRGVPRLSEIFSCSKNCKQIISLVTPKKGIEPHDLSNELRNIYLKDIVSDINIEFSDARRYTYNYNKQNIKSVGIILSFDIKDLYNNHITLEKIVLQVLNNTELSDLVISYTDEFQGTQQKIFISDANIMNCTDVYLFYSEFAEKLKKIKVSGVRNLKNATVDDNIVVAEGTNLLGLMENENVDFANSFTNDFHETLQIFGIEVTRQLIIDELAGVLSESSSIDIRHLNLLGNFMTSTGFLVSIDRSNLNHSKNGVLARCSFEESVGQLYKAALFSETDSLKSISSNVMVGQASENFGTGSVNMTLDEEKFFHREANDQEIQEEVDLDFDF